MRAASAASALALCLLYLTTGAMGQGCSVTFALNPALSNLTLGGAVVAPVQSPLEAAAPGAAQGLQGRMVAQLEGACPADAAALAAALAGATLETTPATGALRLYPAAVTLKAGSLATLQLVGLQFTGSIELGDTAAAAASATLVVSGGYVNNTSILSPDPVRVEVVGVNGTNATAAAVGAAGAEVTVLLPELYLVMRSVYVTELAGAPLEGVSDYVLSGTLALVAAVGCAADCGANGRCAAAEGGGAECECECGWGGDACDVPSGFCPRYASEGGGAATACPAAGPPPAAAAPCVGGAAAACNDFQQYDASQGGCICLPGWTGAGCDACQSDAACSAHLTASAGTPQDATCSNEWVYSEDTVLKSYNCALEGTGLDTLLEPNTYHVVCNTTAPDAPPATGGAAAAGSTAVQGPSCSLGFSLKGKADNPVSCTAACSFTANSSRVECESTECACATACPDVQGVLDRIVGQPCVIDCDPATGTCVFDIKDFFLTLVAPCPNHNCRVQGYRLSEGGAAAAVGRTQRDLNPVLAALPLIALVAVVAALSALVLANRRFFSPAPAGAGTGADAKVAAVAPADALHPQPFDPVEELTFDRITMTVSLARRGPLPLWRGPGATRAVLGGVSGAARRGELVGVLGPSGSGKTSLLAVLAGSVEERGAGAAVGGAVALDGRPLDAASARRVAFCAQDATLLPTLTVEECVRYSALLRLPREASAGEVAAAVGGVIAQLGLAAVAGSVVGGGARARGVSGGERRRVTIAMELVTNPSVLILDEPTSGLDSHAALNLMTTLKQVAASGRIVVLSFHQPSPAMFNLLDRAFLLAAGRCVYSGAPAAAGPHVARLGLPCPQGVALAEHLLRCAGDPGTLPLLLAALPPPGGTAGAADKLDDKRDSADDAEAGLAGADTPPPAARRAHAHAPRAGLGRELSVLFWRTLVDIGRNPALLLLHWGTALAMGVFVGCIFWGVGLDISGAQNRAGGIFFALAFFAFTSLTTVDLLMEERRLVGREVRGGYYAPGSYLLAKAALDGLLLRALPVAIYAAPFYPMMGLQAGALHVGLFLTVLATFAVAVGALSLAVAVGSATAGRASLAMNLALLVSLLVGGFFANVDSIPAWIRWLHYLSPFFYGYSALVTNEVASLSLNFTLDGYAAVQNVRGTTFLQIVGVDAAALTTHIVVLDCMYAAFLALAFALLYLRMPRAQRLKPAAAAAARAA